MTFQTLTQHNNKVKEYFDTAIRPELRDNQDTLATSYFCLYKKELKKKV